MTSGSRVPFVSLPSTVLRIVLEPPEETEPVTATVDHAEIRGLGTTFYEALRCQAPISGGIRHGSPTA